MGRSTSLQISANGKKSKLCNVYGASSMRLDCNQPPWLNIARTTAIKRLHPVAKGSRCSTRSRYDQRWIKDAAPWITCRKFGLALLLKTTSLRQFQIVQTKAQTPTRIRSFVFLSILFNQLSKRLVILLGGGILKVKYTTLQTRREKWQEMNKWSIVSFEPQKTHFVHPVQRLFARLSLVKITFL
jgi:hypothetical protein